MSACAFSVSQIGELAKEVSEDTQNNYDYIPWRSMKGMRNKIVHDYENIDLSVLRGTIIQSLPMIKGQMEKVIETQAESFRILDDEDSEELWKVQKILCKPSKSGKIKTTDFGGFKLCQNKRKVH